MRIFLFINIFLFSTAAFADCLRVDEHELKEVETEFGITTVEWTATIENDCDNAYDGTLTVKFKNKAGEVIHETLEVIVIQSAGTEQAKRSINIPESRYQEVDQVDVAISERQRPI